MVGATAGEDGKKRRKATTVRERRAIEVGRAFAEIIRDQPFARELLVTADWQEPGIYLWLLTDPISMDEERMLFESPMDQLYARFPDEYILILPVHTGNTIGDLHDGPRRDAIPIPLRAG
jgi:hypothetical protein